MVWNKKVLRVMRGEEGMTSVEAKREGEDLELCRSYRCRNGSQPKLSPKPLQSVCPAA